jgi:ribosomal-protein-alanine acetyltransferase
MQIRNVKTDDLRAVLGIQTKCPQAAQWQESDYLQLASDPGGMLLVAVDEPTANKAKWPADQTERRNEKLAGFCVFHRVLDEAELRNLAVAPEHQCRGIAKALLEEAHRRLREAGAARVYLEVRPSNVAARRLYHGLGYRPESFRRNYYHAPLEDAETMLLELR